MGLPITKYTLLKAVAEDRDIFYGSSCTEKLNEFRSFKLYGIILHDPVFHYKFHSKLGKEFKLLDRLTGQDFLFMGLTDLPHEWVEDRQYYSEYKKVFAPGYPGIQEFKSEDPAITAFTLAKALNIDYDDLPCILLTDDLRKNRFHIIRTSGKSLVEQLVKIGDYCSSTERPAMMANQLPYSPTQYPPHLQELVWEQHSLEKHPAFLELIKDISSLRGAAITQIESGLADILAGILSVLAINRNAGESWLAKDHLESFLKEFACHKPIKDGRIDISVLENRLLMIAGILANLKESQNFNFGLNLHEQCEHESHIIMTTFNKVAPIYNSLSGERLNGMDYSPLLVCLGKIFEKELNLSLVHWIRSSLGIEMPDYFNKWKNSQENYVLTPSKEIVSEPKPVNFNENQHGKWRAPSIGGSEYVLRSLFMEQKAPAEIIDPGQFLDKFRDFRKLRNKTAHAEPVLEQDFKKGLDIFRYFIDNEKFNQMNMVKAKLKG